ncbi:3698_t:CDS:2 [Gigaspora margarita]|uniref:3698_t:CDS:1 n=1 Tax=Gigaspora margarita TaxID=4874 RepID=A0ABN7UE88_GIGMA|nr:3698_t:CDS:2 [Gigaspora margarita]
MTDVQENDQNSRNSLSLSENEITSVLQIETNMQPNKEVLSQTITTMPDEIRKVIEVEVNNKQHMTEDMEMDRSDDNQSGIEEEAIADSREGQMLYMQQDQREEINQEIKEVSKMS